MEPAELLHILIPGIVGMISVVSYSVVYGVIDESRQGIFFQHLSGNAILLKKSKLERVHRLIWGLILSLAGVYLIFAFKASFRIEISDVLFYPILIIVFLSLSWSCYKLYLKDGDKILILDERNQLVKINNRPIKFSMISCVLIDYSRGLSKGSQISHEIFLQMKDGSKVYLGYARDTNLPGIVNNLYDFLNVKIVDKSPGVYALGFKNFSREATNRPTSNERSVVKD